MIHLDDPTVYSAPPKTWAEHCAEQQAYTKAAYKLRDDMNNRPQAKASLVRRAEHVMAHAQSATSRSALTRYYKSGRSQAHEANEDGKGLWMSLALSQSYAAAGAKASRSIGTWLAMTAPLDFLVGQSRFLDEECGDNPGLVATGGCSPFSLLRGTAAFIGAPIGAAIGGAIEAAKAMSEGANKGEWSKAMRKGAALGTVVGGVIASRMTETTLAWGQLGAQALVLVLKTAVAIVGATLGILIGLPFGAVRVLMMKYADAKRIRKMRADYKASTWTFAPAASVSSYHTARSTFSDDFEDLQQDNLELRAMASAG